MVDSIGARVRALRAERGMTLAELGDQSGLSTSYLSQIERDKTTPSLATLTEIARALNVKLRHFFETEQEAAYVVRRNRPEQPPAGAVISFQQDPLVPAAGTGKLVVSQLTLAPGASSEQLATFAGEELLFVLAGRLTIVIGDERFALDAGDSIHYDAIQPHCLLNEGDVPCEVIWSRVASALER